MVLGGKADISTVLLVIGPPAFPAQSRVDGQARTNSDVVLKVESHLHVGQIEPVVRELCLIAGIAEEHIGHIDSSKRRGSGAGRRGVGSVVERSRTGAEIKLRRRISLLRED